MNVFGQPQSAPKAFRDGTHRTRSPRETLDAYAPLCPRFGITRLADVTRLDCIGVPVFMSVRPLSRSLCVSQGKGLTPDAAKASALMESIEMWHAERVVRPLVQESLRDLRRRKRVLDPTGLALVAPTFSEATSILWTEGWDLAASEPTWVPFETVAIDLVWAAANRPTFVMSSNGLASGNHVLESIVHGVCEVIERDATAHFMARSARRREELRVDLAGVDQPDCRAVLDLLARAGAHAAVWDLTSRVGVPTYACSIYEPPEATRWRPLGAIEGYGTHLSPGVALLRALTEAVQARLTFIAGARDDCFHRAYAELTSPDHHRRSWDLYSASRPTLRFDARRDESRATFEEDLGVLLEKLRAAGVTRVVAVDLARDDVGIPVTKVVAPELAPSPELAGVRWSGPHRAAPALGAREGEERA